MNIIEVSIIFCLFLFVLVDSLHRPLGKNSRNLKFNTLLAKQGGDYINGDSTPRSLKNRPEATKSIHQAKRRNQATKIRSSSTNLKAKEDTIQPSIVTQITGLTDRIQQTLDEISAVESKIAEVEKDGNWQITMWCRLIIVFLKLL